jgi:hypothetical protein
MTPFVQTPPDVDLELATRSELMEKHALLLSAELRSARGLADRTAATLSLLAGLLASTREADGGFLVTRIFQELLVCANTPELASRIASCDLDLVDPHMIRALATLLTGDVSTVLMSALGEAAVAH